MFVRILSSAAAGLIVTSGLLYLMHYLIDTSEGAVNVPTRITLGTFGRTIEDTEVIVKEQRHERIDDPVEPPPIQARVDPGEEFTGIGVKPIAPTPGPRFMTPTGFQLTDGALINIIAVRPTYPMAASSSGLEGHVVVRFDVTAMGTVVNAVVVDSSSSKFNRSALDAIKKFRFKPKVIDGVPQESFGLQRLFTYEMEK